MRPARKQYAEKERQGRFGHEVIALPERRRICLFARSPASGDIVMTGAAFSMVAWVLMRGLV